MNNQPALNFNFGMAISFLKKGCMVARSGWNGKNMWLLLVSFSGHDVPDAFPHYHLHMCDGVEGLPWIGMKTADNKLIPWVTSQMDVLAEDWQLVEFSTENTL